MKVSSGDMYIWNLQGKSYVYLFLSQYDTELLGRNAWACLVLRPNGDVGVQDAFLNLSWLDERDSFLLRRQQEVLDGGV